MIAILTAVSYLISTEFRMQRESSVETLRSFLLLKTFRLSVYVYAYILHSAEPHHSPCILEILKKKSNVFVYNTSYNINLSTFLSALFLSSI